MIARLTWIRKYKDAPVNRLRRGHQQREANYKRSEKYEEVSRVLSGFSLTLRPRKIQTLFINRRLILASVYNQNHVSVKQWRWPSITFQCSYSSRHFLACRWQCFIQSWCWWKRSYLTDFVFPRKLSNDSERRAQVSTCSSRRSTIAGSTLII